MLKSCKRIEHLAISGDREVKNFGDDIIFVFDLFLETFRRPSLIEKQIAGLFGEQPREMQPQVVDLDFLEDRPQAGRVVGIAMRQHHVLQHRVWPKMLLEMRHDAITGFRVSSVDQHDVVRVDVAVPHNDGVAGFGARTDCEKFDFALHVTSPLVVAARQAAFRTFMLCRMDALPPPRSSVMFQ